jgi:bifunctional oligoribonuclease and PAP phosphatase NrnA
MTTNGGRADAIRRIREEMAGRRRILLTSHARPDGDSIGSQVALAYALRALGKQVQVINRDPVPAFLDSFPGVSDIVIAGKAEGPFDAAIVLECGDLSRAGVEGLEGLFVVNIDHHPGNTAYGAVNWIDDGAAACGEMVFDLIEALGVPLTVEIATHIYVAILTDTGSFHYSHISPRTFDICRRAVEAGVDPQATARAVYDSSTLGRLRLLGSVLGTLEMEASGRLAILRLDQAMFDRSGGTYDDLDGLINIPLTVREIQAVVFFKELEPGQQRVSLRSKGEVDVGRVAAEFGGGGHKNASGFTIAGRYAEIRPEVARRVRRIVEPDAAADSGC